MKKFFKKIGLVASVASAPLMAAPITVDLSDAETSVTNVGTSMIGLAVVMISVAIVYGFIRKRG